MQYGKATGSWAGPGNEATSFPGHSQVLSCVLKAEVPVGGLSGVLSKSDDNKMTSRNAYFKIVHIYKSCNCKYK